MRKLLKRWRREGAIRRHLAVHGGVFHFEGQPIEVPAGLPLGIQSAIAEGEYEAQEIAQIDRHLRPDLPVIELGGCLGLVSAHIGRRLAAGFAHLVVEANPHLLDVCRWNATLGGTRAATTVINGAIAYGVPTIRFAVSANVHASRLADGETPGTVEVATCRLADLVARINGGAGYSLVCDIEGAEYEMLERDGVALAGCETAIIEVHPRVFAERGQSVDGFVRLAAGAGLRPIETSDGVMVLGRAARAGATGSWV